MNLEDLGNLGEFIAAIGVIGSFIYLAFQIRQNTRSINASSYIELTNLVKDGLLTIAANGDLSDLMVKGNSDPSSLNESEWLRLSSFYYSVFANDQTAFQGYRMGTVDPQLYEGFMDSLNTALDSPLIQYWWVERKPDFSPDFKDLVNEILSEKGST